MGETGEFALHPQELAGVLLRLFLAVRDVHLLEIATVLGARGIAGLRRDLVVDLPDVLGRFDRGVERDVRVALLGRPDDRLLAQHAGDPDARIGLLQWHRPRIDYAVLVMRALPAERALPCPRRDNQIVRFLKALAIEGRVNAIGQLLLAAAAHKTGNQAALRDHIYHRQLFGE